MLADMNEWGAFNKVYVPYFHPTACPPAPLRHQRPRARCAGGNGMLAWAGPK